MDDIIIDLGWLLNEWSGSQVYLLVNESPFCHHHSSDQYDEYSFTARATLCLTNEISFEINQRVLDIVPRVERESS